MVLHKNDSQLTHKVPNPFSLEKRELFFFSYPPHLVKTPRNCLASKKRSLWVCIHIGIVLFSTNARCDLIESHLCSIFFMVKQCHIAEQDNNAGPNSNSASIKGLEHK